MISVVTAVRLLPMRVVLGAGTLLGRAFYLFDRGHRRLAIENLRAAFPVRSEARVPAHRAATCSPTLAGCLPCC